MLKKITIETERQRDDWEAVLLAYDLDHHAFPREVAWRKRQTYERRLTDARELRAARLTPEDAENIRLKIQLFDQERR